MFTSVFDIVIVTKWFSVIVNQIYIFHPETVIFLDCFWPIVLTVFPAGVAIRKYSMNKDENPVMIGVIIPSAMCFWNSRRCQRNQDVFINQDNRNPPCYACYCRCQSKF